MIDMSHNRDNRRSCYFFSWIITGKKSVLSYLLKPIIRAQAEALRER